MPDFDYDAFISYRRSDGLAVARWLRHELLRSDCQNLIINQLSEMIMTLNVYQRYFRAI
jgi:hypothetical protein